MNVRKPVDYSAMFTALDALMAADLPQMKLYCEIGRLVSSRPEKGAAVDAAEYLRGVYSDASRFSPRNLRWMREFYRAYERVPGAGMVHSSGTEVWMVKAGTPADDQSQRTSGNRPRLDGRGMLY